jgi:glycosyltransferase involved in cell wall biosynthesis
MSPDVPHNTKELTDGKKILMVLSSSVFPPDGRVEREARDLIRDGHKVFLMARRAPGQAKREDVNGVDVVRVWLPFQKTKAVADFIYFFIHRHLVFLSIILFCRRNRIDVLHVHDLPYALATTLAGKILRIPVVFDMHEYFTVMLKMSFEAKMYRKFKPFAFVLLGLLRAEEKIACRWAKKVIVVADEQVDRIVSLGVNEKDIAVVTNTEDVDHFSGFEVDDALVGKYKDEFVILYVGGFSPHRGLETAIEAMPMVLKEIPEARLLFVGDGNNRAEMEQMSREGGFSERITFTGQQPFAKLPTYIKLCSVGIIPHISTPHIETTMPNKIFQFMMLGRPVIVSSTRPMMRVVDDAKCGLVFEVQNPQSLAEKIIQLKDRNLSEQLGANGIEAVADRYNWQQTVQILLELYRGL